MASINIENNEKIFCNECLTDSDYDSECYSDQDCYSDPGCCSDPDCYSDQDCYSDICKSSNCSEEPVKEGFERVRQSCGWYYDRPIVGAGQERCDGCSYPFPIGTMDTSGSTDNLDRVCDKCLSSGKITKCSKCGVFINDTIKNLMGNSQFGKFYNVCMKMRCGDSLYCKKCVPPLTFFMKVEQGLSQCSTTLEIPIPSDKEWGLPHSYFYDAVAEKLNIPVERIRISGKKKEETMGWMLCPAEYDKLEHKTFNVTVVE